MTERDIHCTYCNIYVGTIRDARLMKGLLFICPRCHEPVEEPAYEPTVGGTDDSTVDYLMNMFGMGGKKR